MVTESIFGSLSPKFVYDLGGANEATVFIHYWVPTKDEPETRKEIIHDSELEADRNIIPLGDYWAFEGYINLLKYPDLASRRSKFEEIYAYNKKVVTLWKHRDGQPFKDSAGNNVLFYLNATPKNFGTLDYRDVLILQFRSLTEVYFSNGAPTIPLISEIIINKNLRKF